MNQDILYFFDTHMEALPLYEALEQKILSEIPDVTVKVQKSQISFYNLHMFGCVSFARVRKKKELPPVFVVLTLGLPYRLESPRVEIATEPYPGRWTHHVLLEREEDMDEELLGWIREAAAFTIQKANARMKGKQRGGDSGT